MPRTIAALKAISCVLGQPRRIAIDFAGRLQQRGDPFHWDVVGHSRHGTRRLRRACPRRRVFQVGAGDGPDRLWMARVIVNPSVDHLVEADLAGVALGDGVRRDEAEVALAGQQRHGAEEEVGDQVGAALRAVRQDVDEPVADVGAHRAGELLAAEERRVADDGVEAAAFHDVGDGEDPVQRLPAVVVGGAPWA